MDTKNIIIQGQTFQATLPYVAGAVLTESEARALNQVRLENIRNNFASKVKASLEKTEGAIAEADLPKAFADFEAAYSFSMPGMGGGRQTLDPIEREALVLARGVVENAMKAKGLPTKPDAALSDDEKAAFKAKVADKVAEVAQRDNIVAAAKKNVKDRAKTLEALGADLDL